MHHPPMHGQSPGKPLNKSKKEVTDEILCFTTELLASWRTRS